MQVQSQCLLLYLAGAGFLALGGYGMEMFLNCDYIQSPTGYSSWSTPAGYTETDFAWLVVGVFCIPVAIVCYLIFILQMHKGNFTAFAKLFSFASLLAFSFFACAVGYQRAHQTLDCWFFCVGDVPSNDDNLDAQSGEVFIGLIYFFVSLMFIVLLVTVIVLTAFQLYDVGGMETYRRGAIGSPLISEGTDRVVSISKGVTSGTRTLSSVTERTGRPVERSYIITMVVLLVLYPLLILACVSLPTWWAYFTINAIRSYQHSTPSRSYGTYWSAEFSSDWTVKLFPDILLFYGCIYIVACVAAAAQYSSSLRDFLHSRKAVPWFGVVSFGELLVSGTMVIMLAGQFLIFYYDHGWQDTDISVYPTEERAARSLGQMANVCVGLLMLPISRNNFWSVVFGISWESMVQFHRYLGVLFVGIVLCHCFCWWKTYDYYGSYPHDIFAVPQEFHADNFTVPLIVFTTICMLGLMIPTTLYVVRRWNYDLFYWSHHFFMILIFAMLWHATMAWYFITGGLILWTVDHLIRLEHCLNANVRVSQLRIANAGGSEIVSLSYQVQQPLSFLRQKLWTLCFGCCASEKEADAVENIAYRALPYEMGQYCFVNIPEISLLEWHPFTIASAPGVDRHVTHHIKSMGTTSWTGKLYQLARTLQSKDNAHAPNYSLDRDDLAPGTNAKLKDLVVNIDGPYGAPLAVENYSALLLVGGGIGITPLHSYFRFLYHAIMAQAKAYTHLRKVRLLWIVRNEADIALIDNTVRSIHSRALSSLRLTDS